MNEPTLYIDSVTPADVEVVAETITDDDHLEFTKRFGQDVSLEAALYNSVSDHKCYVICFNDGRVLALGGVSRCGHIWFVTTTSVEDLNSDGRREFLYMLKCQLQIELSKGKPLRNIVWEGNRKHIALLRKLGAIFEGVVGEFITFHFEPTIGG